VAGTSHIVFRSIEAAPNGVNLASSRAAPIMATLQAASVEVK